MDASGTARGPDTAQPRGRESIAEILVRRFGVPQDRLAEAQRRSLETGQRLELILAADGLVSEEQTALAVGEYLRIPVISLNGFAPDLELMAQAPSDLLERVVAIPLARWGARLTVAMRDPFDLEALDLLEQVYKAPVVPYVAPRSQVEKTLAAFTGCPTDRLAEAVKSMDAEPSAVDMTLGAYEEQADDSLSDEEMMSLGEQAPVVRIVNTILLEALERRASDIHIEPGQSAMHVRYRIDGLLYDEPSPPAYMHWAILSRLKIIAKMDIAERRLPQDGRFSIHASGWEADVRVSMIPTIHGQKAVLRILNKGDLKPSLASLDLDAQSLDEMMHAIRQPAGLILVTGPTGSGKTTTLYSALQEVNDPGIHIVTVEDPVEYQLPRITQIQIHSQIGLTFASCLRSILRQDPDIIMIGEIRDAETAAISVQAALTGHLVLSTLHTINAANAISRLLHMNIEPFLLASTLLLAQAQRIHRKLCPYCRRRVDAPDELLRRYRLDPAFFDGVDIYGPTGCPRCSAIGYKGREPIMEVIATDDVLRDMLLRCASAHEIEARAVERGMVTLRDAALLQARRGRTSLEEAMRVTAHG